MSTHKHYASLPLDEFLNDLAARTSAPGAGTVAALTGSVAAAQAQMVVSFSLDRPQAADRAPRLQQLNEELNNARETFLQLMGEDIEAYEHFAATRRAGKEGETQRALARAIAVPMEIIVMAGAVVARLDEIKASVNPRLLAELKVAAILCYSAARSACTIARINLESLTNQKERERLDVQLDQLVGRAGRHRNAIVYFETA